MTTHSYTLLVVEDSAVQRVMIKRLLEKGGYQVLTAKDGMDGLNSVKTHKPDLVVTDISMPGMDGYEMCREIKQDNALNHIPVLLLTGLDDPKEVIRGLGAGADNYLTKPVDEQHLLERIASLLEKVEDEQSVEGIKGLKISFAGETHIIDAGRRQTLNLLLSTYENAVRKNRELIQTQMALNLLNEHLEDEVASRTRQLEVANRAKTRFIANISHEVRTPMNAIIGMTDLVLSTELGEDQRNLLTIARTSSDALMALLNSLLDFSRLESDQLEVRPAGFDLRQALSKLLHPFLQKAQEKSLSFFCRVDAVVPEKLIGDFPRIGQVLTQLLGNAFKFTETGEIILHVTKKQDKDKGCTVCFSVIDTGIGIEEAQQEWVFESFTQGDGSATRKYGGAGIGLSLAKRLAERVGGKISFHSELGKGSVFHLDMIFEKSEEGGFSGSGVDEEVLSHVFHPEKMLDQEVDDTSESVRMSSEDIPLECRKLLGLCRKAIEEGRFDDLDSWIPRLKKNSMVLKQGDLFGNQVLRTAMAARNYDAQKAMEYLQKAEDALELEGF